MPAWRRLRLVLRLCLAAVAVAIALFAPSVAFADFSTFGQNIQNFSTMQQSLLKQTISIQAYNSQRARAYGAQPAAPQAAPGATPTPQAGTHLNIAVTDFIPAAQGHPVVEQFLAPLPLSEQDRATLRQTIYATFTRVDTQVRRNNLAASMGVAIGTSIYVVSGRVISDAESNQLIFTLNDMIARTPEFAHMSALQKQTTSDSLILVSALILTFNQAGAKDPRVREQSVALAQGLLQHLTGSPTGR